MRLSGFTDFDVQVNDAGAGDAGAPATPIASDSLGPVQAVQRDFPALVMLGRLMLLAVVAAVVLGGVWLALRKKQ